MTSDRPANRGRYEILRFAKACFEANRLKLAAVLGLDALLTSITGIGLLLILPLLGLLGMAPGNADNPLWRRLNAALADVGLQLTLESGLALFALVICGRALLSWRRETWQVEVEQDFQTTLRHRLYETLSRTELRYLQRLRTSEFIQATQGEIRRVQDAVNLLFQLASTFLRLLVYFTVAFLLSPAMTVVVFACGSLAVLAMRPLVRRTHVLSRQQVRVRGSMINNLVEHIQGLRTARSLGLTGTFVSDYRRRSGQSARVAVELTRLSARSALVFEIVAALLLSVLVYVGLARLHVEPARFVVLLLIFIRLFPSIGNLQNQFQRFVGLVPSFRHYYELLDELGAHEERGSTAEGLPRIEMARGIELRAVDFTYHPTQPPSLRNVTLRIDRGTLVAVGGHSGAGKSTLADIVTGLLPPTSGTVAIDGHDLDDDQRMRWRRETALVPQEGFLFNDSIRANLLCVRPDAPERDLWEVLDAVNGRAFVEARAGGLDNVVGERGGLLSGGERQRICIARALLRRPQLLVLDEPTNNLDVASVTALLEVLDSLRDRATLLVISHDPRVLQRADTVHWLADGALVP